MYEENRYKPLSPWAYFGYSILFALPAVGIILALIFSFTARNINLKNFARSYFCGLALVIILVLSIYLLRFFGIITGKTVDFLTKEIKNLNFF